MLDEMCEALLHRPSAMGTEDAESSIEASEELGPHGARATAARDALALTCPQAETEPKRLQRGPFLFSHTAMLGLLKDYKKLKKL